MLTRFDDGILSSTRPLQEETHVSLHTPDARSGRPFLYDADFTSSNGEASCASCHIFGNMDDLAWDLGNPDDVVIPNPLPVKIPPLNDTFVDFHPLKGPMTTQSLRGMANNGSMHWRGDRTGGNDPGGDPFDEDAAFKKFNVAFPGLVGRESELTDAEMQAFTDFVLTITYPPNPNRSTTPEHEPAEARLSSAADRRASTATAASARSGDGQFGTSGFSTFEGDADVQGPAPPERYTKVGMFGRPRMRRAAAGPRLRLPARRQHRHGPPLPRRERLPGQTEQADLERFVMVFDSDLNPIVGQQVTLTATTAAAVTGRLNLMMTRDDALECEVVVKGTIGGEARGGHRLSDGTFQMDRAGDVRTDVDLRALATTPGQELTYTCVPPGSGVRMGVDRDEDGVST